jgi:2,4-dienoyl-CoA reductase-like NADH-dependent reductase (Old Yellow Enzyme family)
MELLRRWAAAATSKGAQCWVQLSHPGRQSMRTLSWTPVAPSAVSMKFGRGLYGKPRALREDEILDIIARFARSAAVLKEAGFSGVQLHAAHGYLISAFLSPLTNVRTDRWGGSVENRQRFLFEVYRATRAAVGPDFPIAIKLNSADFQRGGFTEDESMQVVRRLEEEGIDLIEISGGSYESAAMMGLGEGARESTRAREAYFLEYAEQVRAITQVPLMLTGGFRSMEGMTHAVGSNAVDVVGLGRPLCMEPDLPRLLLAGELDEYPVAPRRMGVRELDTILEVFWFTQQLHKLAKGQKSDPHRSNVLTLLWVGVHALVDTVRMRLRM